MKALYPAAALVLGAVFLALAPSCEEEGCSAPQDCPDGQTCGASGQCVVVSCTSSNDCPMESYCDVANANCVAGCLVDRDCLPTHVCDPDQKECIVPGCRSTELDCQVGEFCNVLSGQCVDAGSVYCDECGSRGDCNNGNAEGPNWCLSIGGQGPYCGVDCSAGQTCPRGYDCLRVITVGNVTVAYQCAGPCWEYN